MTRSIGLTTLLVHDYDDALAFFTDALRFRLVEDTLLGTDKRWLVVAPEATGGAALLLAKAATPEQAAQVGNQAGDVLLRHDQAHAGLRRLRKMPDQRGDIDGELSPGIAVVGIDADDVELPDTAWRGHLDDVADADVEPAT